MVNFTRHHLDNGLTIIHHYDENTPFVVTNVLYKVGARDEQAHRTGFAHLFEHLMFEGSKNAPYFDEPLQLAGGENNAFTNNDCTNYYCIVPATNAETPFWLEADRMAHLNINKRSLDVQRKVVIEEFKENYINQPYGNVWHLLRDMVFRTHAYRWPTIGLTISHLEEAKLEEVKDFYDQFYNPANAVLVVSGNISEKTSLTYAEKWFGPLKGKPVVRTSEPEKEQTEQRRKTVYEQVPVSVIYIAFKSPARTEQDFYVADIVSDLLSGGMSSRMYVKLVRQQKIFSEIDVYTDSAEHEGMFIIEGKMCEEISPEEAEEKIWEELRILETEPVDERELCKVRNKSIANLYFSDSDLMERTVNLAYYEMLGDAELTNKEKDRYEKVKPEDIPAFCKRYLTRERSNVLYYLKKV